MKKISILLAAILCSCQHQPHRELASEEKLGKLQKKIIKAHFKKMPEEERIRVIQKARVTDPAYDAGKVPSIDVIGELEKFCGERFRYPKVAKSQDSYSEVVNFQTYDVYQWPRLECRYKPDDGDMGGWSKKFLCEFESREHKDGFDTIKVRYPRSPQHPIKSEVLDTILATQMTKLVGFYAETYCPAEVTCRNCPSESPWDNNRAQDPGSQATYDFPWTILEHQLPFQSITSRPPKDQRNQGLEWKELKLVQTEDPALARQMRIEREAWMLWLNFLQHMDAGYFNQRVSCAKVVMGADGKPSCAQSVLYTHDFGHTFLWSFKISEWLRMPTLRSAANGETCRGTLVRHNEKPDNPVYGEVFEPAISAEARDFLVGRLSRVTDSQWLSIFQLARVEEVTRVTSSDWLRGVKFKIQQMKSAHCLPFDSGRSVLANGS